MLVGSLRLSRRCPGFGSRSLATTSSLFQGLKIDSLFEGSVKSIALDSPKTRNALSLDLLESLNEEISLIDNDSSIRAVLLSSPHKVFSGGHNLKEMESNTTLQNTKIFQSCQKLMEQIEDCPVPVIASLGPNQVVAAAGTQLIASCDIVLAAPSTTFSTPGASVGLFCSSPGVPLSRNVPRKISAYMLLTGLPINGKEAYEAGLISRLIQDPTESDKILKEIIYAIRAKPKGVIELGKKFYYQQMNRSNYREALSDAGDVMVKNIDYRDCREGIRAFIEKRKPSFQHNHDKID